MIDLILYSINDGDNVINKNLVNGVNVPIHLKQWFDIINPDIVLNGDYRGFNYAHIPSLNRFYFINNVEQLNLRLVKLNMTCDVLETYKVDILNSNARFKRNIKTGDFENISIDYSNKTTSVKHISNGAPLQGETMIIAVLGG
jgi:hypothetical protein